MKKEVNIQLIRILSMLMIILCHVVQEYGKLLSLTAQFFNVGVYIFLLLSGFLYGNKIIDNKVDFYVRRIKKILVPMYFFLILFFILNFKYFSLKWCVIYLFDIQYFMGNIKGLGHLWFMSIIMLCYLSLPFLSKNKNRLMLFVFSYFSLAVTFSFINETIARVFFYLLMFTIGYCIKSYNIKCSFNITQLVLFFILTIIFKLTCWYLFDNTLYYNIILSSIDHICLSIEIFYILNLIFLKFKVKNNKYIDYFDSLSIYIYFTHYMFIVGPEKTINLTNDIFFNLLLTLLFSYFSAILVYKIYMIVTNISLNIKKNSIL